MAPTSRDQDEAAGPPSSIGRALVTLLIATAGTAWMSEILVGSISPMMQQYGLSNIFVGAFVVAILGNAAEHATAITAALNNRMDLSFSIAVGSSVQVALFVAPVLVLASLFIGPIPMDLAFRPVLVLIVILSVVVTAQMASDGYADWFKGVQLLVVYFTLALTFFSCQTDWRIRCPASDVSDIPGTAIKWCMASTAIYYRAGPGSHGLAVVTHPPYISV